MREYFKDEQSKKIKLSEYLKMKKSKFKDFTCEEEDRIPRTKYIIEAIGDVELDIETYELFLTQFQCWGGRYDVRTKKETLKGIYDISVKYPFLTKDALEEIWFVYIHDQFEEYHLADALEIFIRYYGMTDKALLTYIEYVDERAKEFDKKFEEEASRLDEYSGEYDEDLIKHLKYIIESQHISSEQIVSSLPSRELIEKDREQLIDISRQTRIFFGACQPISYQMIEILATSGSLDYYPEQPQYVICGTSKVEATFTKQEFLDSAYKKQKTMIKRK